MENKEREIFGGDAELIKFFCKDSGEDSDKEFCRYIVDYDKKYCIYNGIYTSYEDGDVLYNDLLNPNIKWSVTFEANCEALWFENGENYVVFDNENYDDIKDFFK